MTQASPHSRRMPDQEFLEGLARLHPFVLLANADGGIEWMNDRLRAHFKNPSLPAHVPKRSQLDALRIDLRAGATAGVVQLDVASADGAEVSVDARALASGSETDTGHTLVVGRPRGERPRTLDEIVSPLTQILENSPSGVLAFDRSGYVTYANPRAAAFLGRESSDLVGQPVAVFVSQARGTDVLLRKLRDPADWNGEEVELVEGEESRWIAVSTRRLLDDDGHEAGIITYLEDITERHLVKKELERKNVELESYVHSVAHDLRSPLVSLLGFTRLLREDYEDRLDETAHHFLDRVESAGRTMDALIHDLLELSRIRKPDDVRPSLDPRSVLQQLGAELKLRLEERGIELVLPESPPLMQIDGTRLYQVFSNLVGNAIKHAFGEGAGEGPRRIAIEIRDLERAHEIAVRDNGRGLAEGDQERVFQVFQTGRGVRRGERSHGIGLAIVKKIAEAHGGRVWVDSEPGKGASFHVLFPKRS